MMTATTTVTNTKKTMTMMSTLTSSAHLPRVAHDIRRKWRKNKTFVSQSTFWKPRISLIWWIWQCIWWKVCNCYVRKYLQSKPGQLGKLQLKLLIAHISISLRWRSEIISAKLKTSFEMICKLEPLMITSWSLSLLQGWVPSENCLDTPMLGTALMMAKMLPVSRWESTCVDPFPS